MRKRWGSLSFFFSPVLILSHCNSVSVLSRLHWWGWVNAELCWVFSSHWFSSYLTASQCQRLVGYAEKNEYSLSNAEFLFFSPVLILPQCSSVSVLSRLRWGGWVNAELRWVFFLEWFYTSKHNASRRNWNGFFKKNTKVGADCTCCVVCTMVLTSIGW